MNTVKFLLLVLTLVSAQVSQSSNKISKQLEKELMVAEMVDLYIILKSDKEIKAPKSMNRMQRLNSTIAQLKSNANKKRNSIETLVKTFTDDYEFYWINNSLRAKMSSLNARKIADNSEVLKVYSNKSQKLSFIVPENNDKATSTTEWGLNMIKVPEVWSLGIKGEGVIIAGQDTGYQWNHPALKDKYAGWNGSVVDHNYTWHDSISSPNIPCLDGNNNPASCDDHGHGTHTMGTMLGDDGASNQIGVAPDAKWIGCRNMNQGDGTPASYTECYQFFLEPTDLNGLNPDSSKAPHIINNSWACPPSEGCIDPNALKSVVNNVNAAGILIVSSAGNSGPGCHSVNTPSAIYENTFTVGSIDPKGLISSFSSRGSVSVDGSNRIKPNIVAPGGSIRSAWPNSSYTWLSGTSMASPHVAGVAALMISANPLLAGNPELIKAILEESSVPQTSDETCNGVPGSTRPNNTYGWGRIDAKAAVDQATKFMGPSHSALWSDPEQSGHGLSVYMLEDNRILVIWYVYDNSGNPIWLFGIGTHDGSVATIDVNLYDGSMFPPNFDENDVNATFWGQFRLSFNSCDSGLFEWMPVHDNGFSAGEMNVSRINTTLGLSCSDDSKVSNKQIDDVIVSTGTSGINAMHTALWSNPDQSGHGINVFMLPNNNLVVIWYVYDDSGNPIWLFGMGSHDGKKATIDVKYHGGAMFPPNFNADNLTTIDWGTFELEFSGCDTGLFKWLPIADNGFSAGEMDIQRINKTLGLSCSDK